MKYTELKQLQQVKLDELNKKYGLFWAFNKNQFEEGMKKNPSKTGKYTSIGMGGYLPSSNVTEWLQGFDEIDKWMKAERKRIKREEAILYELNNYECFYTGEIDDACDALEGTYTREEIKEVYRNHLKTEEYRALSMPE